MNDESVKKILVIEDDTVSRNLYVKGLRGKGFDVMSVENGFTGIQKAQENVPDLVVCDVTMPDIDGYGVLTMLRQDPVTAIIPFIFITGSSTRKAVRKGMELGADDYITKPFTLDELLRTITTQLQRQAFLQSWCAAKFQEAQKSSLADDTSALNQPQSIFPCIPQLKKVFDFIEAHYHEGITLCDVAEAVGYSPAYLTNQVGKQTGETINSWIVKRRMEGARFLLQNDQQTVEQIARALGYQDVSHFSRQFRQHHGLPPHAWRKEHQAGYSKVKVSQ
ncbi:response regulator transcription factor [Chrysosporum bergii ANA360D]|jgi:YesN/AraC family two-component response regulator|uniref:Response regulator transcription factor n=1 Tax=Chrysosporum bergii ANA360D TaxID=617107 RepID=A0AA43KCX7_9CYAN|nr:response regulator transcription factor [Chrysosporum bergii]MDH6061859.1 response regulator transcription factor [Chrysosporum bergii ANA360D]